ncbi:MAG TPA: DUF4097 family beta strand repeat-containing protein [Longimicrobiales bacterium]|nr:DUF4097 family beta strand repeat-containing protein [Longimicrobiales bacterium]
MRFTPITTAILAVALFPAAAAGQDFKWSGRLSPGQTLEVRGINGKISAMPAAGDLIEVVAEKSGRRSDPDEVEIRVVEHRGGVTICAVYPSPPDREPNGCAPGGSRNSTRDNDVKVDFTVRVPAGIRLVAATVNGNVSAEGLRGDVESTTVNGSIHVTATGLVRARTVNGSIEVELGRTDWQGDLSFETVNGAITVALPGDLHTELRAETLNGSITADFPITISGRIARNRIHGTIGDGGRTLRLRTVNGGIRLRKVS